MSALPLLTIIAVGLTTVEAAAQGSQVTFDPSLGVDLSTMVRTGSGLYSKVLAPGLGEPASLGTRLRVEFIANLPNGTQFSATPEGEPMELVLDGSTMIPGFTEGLIGIRAGESRLLVIPPEIGYGERGIQDIVPPGATLVFRVRRVGETTPNIRE